MGLLQKKDITEIKVSKHIDDLKGIDDVLYEPRSWSPDDLKEACNNVKFESNRSISEMDSLTVQYLMRYFFYLLHQTGLYNPQKKLWSHLAQVKKIKIKPYKKLNRKEREAVTISDIILEDSTGKFLLARLVHPGSTLSYPSFKKFISSVPNKCVGLFYISDKDPDTKTLELIKGKTNANDFFDKYRSPISANCSFNLIKYEQNGGKLNYKLIHPDLNKNVEAELCLES